MLLTIRLQFLWGANKMGKWKEQHWEVNSDHGKWDRERTDISKISYHFHTFFFYSSLPFRLVTRKQVWFHERQQTYKSQRHRLHSSTVWVSKILQCSLTRILDLRNFFRTSLRMSFTATDSNCWYRWISWFMVPSLAPNFLNVK